MNKPTVRRAAAKPHPSTCIDPPRLPLAGFADGAQRTAGDQLAADWAAAPAELTDRCSFADTIVSDRSYTGQEAERVIADRVCFRNVDFSGTILPRMELIDVRFEACDLSNASWPGADFTRVELVECRLSGLKLIEADLRHVKVAHCNAAFAAWRVARFKHVRFDECLLSEADFSEADLRGVAFARCNLSAADFSSTQLVGCDLRTSTLDGLRVGAASLRGAIVEPLQAAWRAVNLGLDVRWE
jgi:uncharacterized protein YjbI with pentapeptide repeats